jgi:hypothetical protein
MSQMMDIANWAKYVHSIDAKRGAHSINHRIDNAGKQDSAM